MFPQYQPCIYRSIETHNRSEHAQYLFICLWCVSRTSTARAIAKAARRWLLITETRVQSIVTSSEVHGGGSGTIESFSPSCSVYPVNHSISV